MSFEVEMFLCRPLVNNKEPYAADSCYFGMLYSTFLGTHLKRKIQINR